ncbi:hypothetical protein ACHAP8_008153 [Fusarium lateritium]
MSIPINIPTQALGRPRSPWDSSPFPEDEGPYMGYTETFENGHVYRAVSSGSGRFIAVGSQCTLPFLSFSVEKERASNTIAIKFRSRDLKQVICHVLGYKIVPALQLTLCIGQVLQHYDGLRAELDSLVYRNPYGDTSKEMRLLVDDLLLERSLYDGFDMGRLRQQGVITPALLRDIHQRNMDLGVNDLEECFQLGGTSEEEAKQYLEAQNAQIDKYARTGNLDLLREFCEPLLRSNDIRVIFNLDLLSQILDKGFLNIYVYILDLVERTRSTVGDIADPHYSDITYHPLCVAIRLGRCSAVHALIQNKLDFFEGYIEDASGHKGCVFTPLLAAVLWQQVGIIRLLLDESALYNAELAKANELAAETRFIGLFEEILEDLTKPKTSAHDAMSARYPVLKAPQFLPAGRSSPCQSPSFPSPGGNSYKSGISSALSGSWQDQRTHMTTEHFVPNPPSLELPSAAVTSPSVPDFCISPQDLSISQVLSPVLSPQFDPLPVPNEWPPQNSYGAVQEWPARPMLLDYTCSYKRRSYLGHSSMHRLQQNCRRIEEFCEQRGDMEDYGNIQHHCTNPMSVSRWGLNHLRNILRNQVPPGLPSVLQALLVADALICQLPDSGERDIEFTQDLYRWKAVTFERDSDMDMFDELVCVIWETDYLPQNILPGSQEDLLRFGELAKDLVSVTHIKPPDPKPIGTRIRAIQRKMQGCHKGTQNFGITALPGSESATERGGSEPDVQIVDPKVVVLLQSVALNVLLATSSAIQDAEDNGTLQHLFGAPASMNRSTAIVEDYISFDGKNFASYDSGIGMGGSLENSMSPWTLATKDTHASCESFNRPLEVPDEVHLDPVLWSFEDNSLMLPEQQEASLPFDDILTPLLQDSGTTLFSEAQLTGAPAQTAQSKDVRATPSKTDWLREPPNSQQEFSTKMANLTCKCGKVFSSKSNLGKHERTACSKRVITRLSCRYSRLGCQKKSTTKWNRDIHEKRWCSFNPNRERRI